MPAVHGPKKLDRLMVSFLCSCLWDRSVRYASTIATGLAPNSTSPTVLSHDFRRHDLRARLAGQGLVNARPVEVPDTATFAPAEPFRDDIFRVVD